MTTLTLVSSVRNSIFHILGTAQFSVKFNDDRELSVWMEYKGKYVRSGSDSFIYRYNVDDLGKVNSRNLSKWYRDFVYQNKDSIKGEIERLEKEIVEENKIKNQYKTLEKKYDELVGSEGWFFAPDFCFDLDDKEALVNDHVWAFKKNSETGWGYNIPRDSFILEVQGAEIIRYDYEQNCYFSMVDYGLSEKVEAIAWYKRGFHHGYDCGYSGNIDPDYQEPSLPDFPNSVAEEVFMRGLSHGGHQGYMDT